MRLATVQSGSMATEGSTRVTPVLGNLANPTSFAVSNGYLYWAEPLGRVRRANLTADPIRPENLATGLGEPLSLAIAKGKVYWTERSGNGGSGKLQRANLNGTNIEELRTFAGGVPLGIAIDTSDNKIYMTRPQGKIQRSNLAGRFVADVVNGLMSPGSIALGIAATPAPDTTQPRQPTRTTTPTTPTTPTTYSKYDINKDGAVNNRDTRLVAGAVGQSGAAIKNPRTDVNDSGTVDVTDLILVIANLDDDVAAPAIDIDLQAMDLDFDRVQEQVELLLSSGDRSHAAQRALLYLQHLLASARPDTTVLLANYPNPFNPETWIPYHLARKHRCENQHLQCARHVSPLIDPSVISRRVTTQVEVERRIGMVGTPWVNALRSGIYFLPVANRRTFTPTQNGHPQVGSNNGRRGCFCWGFSPNLAGLPFPSVGRGPCASPTYTKLEGNRIMKKFYIKEARFF